ncbi:MAG: cadherin repeat domain-containing protein, partial [bacterium]|nr:cadherin repeat domain-containing protein [bacterium]
ASDSVTYTLSNDANGLFAINSTTGEVTTAGKINYESATSHNITVLATSTDGSTSSADMTINVKNVNEDIGPIIDTDSDGNSMVYTPSNAVFSYASGKSLGDGVAEGSNHQAKVDSDKVSNLSITLSTGDTTLNAGETIAFSFTDENGKTVTVNNAIIQQTAFAKPDANETGVLTAQGKDANGNEIAILVKFNENDGSTPTPIKWGDGFYDNDVEPYQGRDIELPITVLTPSAGTSDLGEVSENVAVGTPVGITALAIDVDASDSVTYTLSNDANGLFAINSTTGEVTTAG